MHSPPVNPERPLENCSVLLVEDELRLRTIVRIMLEELGAKVVDVGDGQAAISEYTTRNPRFDIVLLDVQMEQLDGGAVFERLIESDKQAKVVLSSGIRPDDTLLARVREHHGGFIEKPYDLDRLGEVLTSVLFDEC